MTGGLPSGGRSWGSPPEKARAAPSHPSVPPTEPSSTLQVHGSGSIPAPVIPTAGLRRPEPSPVLETGGEGRAGQDRAEGFADGLEKEGRIVP